MVSMQRDGQAAWPRGDTSAQPQPALSHHRLILLWETSHDALMD